MSLLSNMEFKKSVLSTSIKFDNRFSISLIIDAEKCHYLKRSRIRFLKKIFQKKFKKKFFLEIHNFVKSSVSFLKNCDDYS